MNNNVYFILAAVKLFCILFIVKETSCITTNDVEIFLQKYNKYAAMLMKITSEISWELDLGDIDKNKVQSALQIKMKAKKYMKLLNEKAETVYNSTKELSDLSQDLKRQLVCINKVSTPRSPEDEKFLEETVKRMEKIYTTARVRFQLR